MARLDIELELELELVWVLRSLSSAETPRSLID